MTFLTCSIYRKSAQDEREKKKNLKVTEIGIFSVLLRNSRKACGARVESRNEDGRYERRGSQE